MKAILLTLTSLLLTFSAHAQGTVEFANDASTAIYTYYGPLVPAGNTYLAQLYYGPAGMIRDETFISVTNSPVGFTLAGQFLAGTRYTTLPGGSTGSFQVRVWAAVLGSDWETAYVNWQTTNGPYAGKLLGKSGIIQVVVADPFAVPPQTPTSLVASGFQGFWLRGFEPVPEPSTLALGAVGVTVLLWRRRKTR